MSERIMCHCDHGVVNGNGCIVVYDGEECPLCSVKEQLRIRSIPAEDRYGREPYKVKPLAQYLSEYIDHEIELGNLIHTDLCICAAEYNSVQKMFEQALDAYESTENVKIKIERV